MAELTSFVLGVLGADFEQLKTSDNIYLKDLLKNEVESSLEEYNSRELALTKLLCRKYDESSSTEKRTLTQDSFEEIGEIQTPGMFSQFNVWNFPVPIRRFGSLTMMTRERVQLMTADQFLAFHNAKMEADLINCNKKLFQAMMLKTPTARVDALDGKATTAKAFWNDEASMDTPESNGQVTFDGDHDHYNATSGIGSAGANIQTHIMNTLAEHKNTGNGQIVIWCQSGATANLIKGESTYFRAVQQASEILGALDPKYNDTGRAQAVILGAKQLGFNVKIIGTWKEAIVIETPDMPTNYLLGTIYMGENNRYAPVAWRQHPAFKGLTMVDPNGGNPLIGKNAQYRRYLGLGVNYRSAGAALYLGDTSWAEPTFS